MLETPEERIKLLRSGFTGKEIEKLYIESNNFKIVRIPILIELWEIDTGLDKKTCICSPGLSGNLVVSTSQMEE